ncbi:predicted protein [Uncinocarpus reesii 1704]|uniref:Uncharacterized protein n=1 Tax=Uncinocarpus reesii (strain UAMH 1704) TaxID=336963 RepID=C4JUM6_UNCRE|nr:uncharacterized protein UREG_04829 [Uncinocarpus reesii 1704]EEP79987.1 predicted protein [Uncinocarpus reesii 1704]
MSNIPKARRSNVVDLTVIPDKWDYYPCMERSYVKSCTFTNLSSSTHIRHSQLKDVKLHSENGKCSYIEHCNLAACTISDSYLGRCQLRDSRVEGVGHMERSTASNSELVGAGNIERSTFRDSKVGGRTTVTRSEIKQCSLGESSRVENSVLDTVFLWNSQVDKAVLTGCDVKDCKMTKTKLSGMVLRYGIWNGGDLVGRTSREHEVIAMPLEEWKARESLDEKGKEQAQEADSEDHTAATPSPVSDVPANAKAPLTLHINPSAPPSYASLQQHDEDDSQARVSREFTPPTPSSTSFSDVTELVDDEMETVDPRSAEKERPPPPYQP